MEIVVWIIELTIVIRLDKPILSIPKKIECDNVSKVLVRILKEANEIRNVDSGLPNTVEAIKLAKIKETKDKRTPTAISKITPQITEARVFSSSPEA